MPFSTRNIEITGTFGPIRIQLSVPETLGRHPAVLLGHEGIGVNAHLRATAKAWKSTLGFFRRHLVAIDG
jgi:dienelactone hydrolase